MSKKIIALFTWLYVVFGCYTNTTYTEIENSLLEKIHINIIYNNSYSYDYNNTESIHVVICGNRILYQ